MEGDGLSLQSNLEWLSDVAREEAAQRGLSERTIQELLPVLEDAAARMDEREEDGGDVERDIADTNVRRLVAKLAELEEKGQIGIASEEVRESIAVALSGLCPGFWPFC